MGERFRSLGTGHRVWFFSVLVLALLFLVFIPPFQTNDEPAHWRRVWSVASGHLTCGQVPTLVTDTARRGRYWHVRDLHEKFTFQAWDDLRDLKGTTKTERAEGNACVYVPVAYVIPALLMRPFINVFDPREGAGMLTAFYVSRAANWLLLGAGVLLFLLYVPQLRNLTLVLYSLPMVIQQTVVVNQEATFLVFAFLLFWLWWRPPSLGQVLAIFAIVTLLSSMKAVFLVLLLFWAAALWRWKTTQKVPLSRALPLLLLAAIPLGIQAAWSHYVVAVSGKDFLPGWGVDPEQQLKFLRERPSYLWTVLKNGHADLLGRGHMSGGWISVLGVLGWADYEIGERAYQLLLGAIALGVIADLLAPTLAPGPSQSASRSWLSYGVPMVSMYLLIPATMVAMYLVFTGVQQARPLGVQGRYLLFPYFMLLAFAVDFARRWLTKRGWLSAALTWLCAGMCLWAGHDALRAVLAKYY
jgi:uncharacterized membrane protein